MIRINHLSIVSKNPETTAIALAEMSLGVAKPFPSKNMPGAWQCVWDETKNLLVEFLPDGYLMYATDYGADFKKMDSNVNYKSSHFQIEVNVSLSEIKKISDKYNFRHSFRPSRGGPLYDVWFEEQLLIEFTSNEIRSLKSSED